MEVWGDKVVEYRELEQKEPWNRVSTLGTAPGAPSGLE